MYAVDNGICVFPCVRTGRSAKNAGSAGAASRHHGAVFLFRNRPRLSDIPAHALSNSGSTEGTTNREIRGASLHMLLAKMESSSLINRVCDRMSELQNRPHASQEDLSLECPLEAIAPAN